MTSFYCWLLSSNDTNYTKLFCFITRWTRWTWWLAHVFSENSCISWCPLAKIIISCWINFCPRSPKPMNSYNSLIIMDITSYIPIKSPKIHPKSLLLYIFFANFLSYPFSKIPDPNDVVSSINAYGVNSWHLIGYEGWKKATERRKHAIKCLISAIYYIFFVLCARIGI